MLNFIIGILTIGFYIVSIISFIMGVCGFIEKITKGTGWEKFLAIVAVIAGIYVFSWTYNWAESIITAMFTSGAIVSMITVPEAWESKGESKKSEYTFGQALLDSYIEQELRKEAVKDAIRELKDEL